MSPLQGWCVRACLLFAAVYLLGFFDVPTQVPYIAAVLFVGSDAVRVWKRERST
jgi:hypothetical protein